MNARYEAGRLSSWCLIVVTLALAFPILGRCQGNLGGLTGRVTDPSGAAVPDVTVTVTNLDTGTELSFVSTTDGTYLASSLSPGRYRVTAGKSGFKTITQEPVVVSTATVSTLDFALVVGAVTESITVAASAAQLQTTSAEIGTVMPDKGMLDLPISLGGAATIGASGRRQIQNFIYLTPGVTGNQWTTTINGSPGLAAYVLMDGGDMQNIGAPGFIAESAPPYEAVSEFKVQNTLYPAQYGLGYGIMNFTMKSGTNAFHGDLFEFLRNDALDACGFWCSEIPIRQNEFGGTIGGPVIFPHYNGKDKTHFFFAWSGFRLRGGLPKPGLVTLPSMQERAGDFTDYPFPIFDPATTQPDGQGGFVRQQIQCNGVLNVICPDRISAVAQRVISLIPPPDIPNTPFFNYLDRASSPSSDDDWSVKVDHQITPRQLLTGSYWSVNANTVINGPVAGALNNVYSTPNVAKGLRINHSWTISPTLLNHAVFALTQENPAGWAVALLDPRLGNQTLQIPGIPMDSHGYTEFHFDTPPYPYLGNSSTNGYDPQIFKNWAVNDDLSWVKGRHQAQFGFEYRRRTMDCRDQTTVAGQLYFSNMSSSQPDDANFANWGNSFASLMLGQVLSGDRAIATPEQHFHDTFNVFYGQDSIKMTSKLTLNLGLRYELPIYAIEDHGIMALFNPTLPNPGAGGLPGALQFYGNGPGRSGRFNLFGTYHRSIMPRISLAYEADKKTVVRLGYGIFRLYPDDGDLNNPDVLVEAPGFGGYPSYASTNAGITPAFNLDQGFPPSNVTVPDFDPSLNNGGTVTWFNSGSNKPAFMQGWTVDIQRELPSNMMLDAAYVGSHTTGYWAGLENIDQVDPKYLSLGNLLYEDVNSPDAVAAGIKVPYPGFQGSVAQALRPYPQYTTINDFYQPTGYSDYNALQVRLEKRYSNGLALMLGYTLSKNIGVVASNIAGSWFGGAALTGINTYDRRIEKSLASTDQTHVLVLAWSYDLPFGRGKRLLGSVNPVVNQLVGGWQVNAIQSYDSGTPIGVSGGGDIPLFGGGNRPNWVSSNVRSSVPMGSFDPAVDLYLNINAFSQPAPFTFGNAPPLLPNVRTPAYYDEDMSVFKKIFLRSESRYLEIRGEFFNAFNRVVFAGPSANINNPSTFGVISGQANTPRVIQIGMKLIF